jgi:signal transduction histidine kinase
VEHRRVQTLTANDAVVAIRLDLPGMFENILQLRPQTTTIAVVIGNSLPEKSWVEELRRKVQPITDRVRFVWLDELPLAEIQRRTATLPSASAIFFAPPSVDAAGVVYEEDGALARIHAVANAPMFSYVDGFLGQGIVGGLLISLPDTSRQVASVAFRILQGDAPDRITTPPIDAKPAFDWRELKRWNISDNSLPAGSEIRFRTPTLWEQYNIQIIAVAAAILMQSILMTGLLFEGHRRRLAEFKSRQRLRDMAHMDRAASAGALSASIAHELNQPLGAILSNAEAAEMLLSGKIPDVDQVMDILADIRRDDERAGEIIKRLRGLLKKEEIRLQAINLNDLIDDVLRLLLPEAAKRGVALITNRENTALSVLADRVHLQQVVLNLAINGMDAMLNCPRRTLTVGTSRFSESEIELSVADTGPGIPKDRLKGIFEWFITTKDQGTGLGLSIARTLIETYGGRIWAENREAGGAVFRFTLPLTKAH